MKMLVSPMRFSLEASIASDRGRRRPRVARIDRRAPPDQSHKIFWKADGKAGIADLYKRRCQCRCLQRSRRFASWPRPLLRYRLEILIKHARRTGREGGGSEFASVFALRSPVRCSVVVQTRVCTWIHPAHDVVHLTFSRESARTDLDLTIDRGGPRMRIGGCATRAVCLCCLSLH